jgi:hypothetical protein
MPRRCPTPKPAANGNATPMQATASADPPDGGQLVHVHLEAHVEEQEDDAELAQRAYDVVTP